MATLSAVTTDTIPTITKSIDSWPEVVYMHGITGNKESALILSAALSPGDFATAAINHPLHGDRDLCWKIEVQ